MKHQVRSWLTGRGTLFIAALFATFFSAGYASAYGSGITGQSTVGCGGSSCHGGSANSATSVSITSSTSFTVPTGGTLNLTAVVGHSTQSAAGIDISVSSGTLSPSSGSGLQSMGSELTHSSPKNLSGGQASFSFTYTAPSSPGTYSLRAAGNAVNGNSNSSGDVWNIMSAISITVTANPTVSLTAPTGATSWCAGSTQNITWTSSSITNVKIELSTDGGSNYNTTLVSSTAASAGSWSWAIPGSLASASSYRVRISDASNASVNSESPNFTIAGGPTINIHPQPQTKCTGQTASFTVNASGSNLTYQWRKDGANLNGQTSSTLSVPVVSTSGGNYDVVVTACGQSLTSSQASLTVNLTPSITAQPDTGKVACVGQNVVISVEAAGSSITYKWKKNGTVISGATTNTLNLNSITVADSGTYTAEVSGTCTPAAISNAFRLHVSVAPQITVQPTSKSATVGQNVTFSVTATGTNLKYQWRKNGMEINNATNASYTINAVKLADKGNIFDVVVSNQCSTVVSAIVELNVTQPGAGAVFNVASSLDFGKTALTLSTEKTIQITNGGDSTLKVTAVTLNGSDFTIVSGGQPFELVPNAAPHVITLKFSPTAVGNKTATLNFTSNAKTTPSVALTGIAVEQKLALSVNSVAFGEVTVNGNSTSSVEITNNGDLPAVISTIQHTAAGNEFMMKNSLSFPYILEPNAKLKLDFEFSPKAEQEYKDTFQIEIVGLQPIRVALAGTGKVSAGVDEIASLLSSYSVSPNPAESNVRIAMNLTSASWVSAEIVDAQGNVVRRIADRIDAGAGDVSLNWDGRSDSGAQVANGVYRALIRTKAGVLALPVVITR